MNNQIYNNPTLEECTFVICDVETTGINPLNNKIIELSLLRVESYKILKKYSTLVNPLQHIPGEITTLTGISDKDVIKMPTFTEIAEDVINFFSECDNKNLIFVGHNVSFDYRFLKAEFQRVNNSIQFKIPTLCTCKLARRLLTRLKSKSLANVAAYLGINNGNFHRSLNDAITTYEILIHFINRLNNNFKIYHLLDLLSFQHKPIYTRDNPSQPLKRLNLNLKDIPQDSGVYIMKSSSGEVLYVGKAKNLKERLSSYFRHNSEMPSKIRKLIANIRKLEFIVTDSELSALILESKLIKDHKPRFNTALKNFRKSVFLKLDVTNEFPRLEKVHQIENDGAFYYGPFSGSILANNIAKEIHNNFRLRKCKYKKIKPSPHNSVCMYYNLNQCDAPCISSIDSKTYHEEVEKAHKYIVNDATLSYLNLLKAKMNECSQRLEFEKAAEIRNQLIEFEKVLSFQKVITSVINNKKLIIKCDSSTKREVFFIQNGKLVKTYCIPNCSAEVSNLLIKELTDTIEYLFFSINKFAKHTYTQRELDEIKVISNWLALTRDRNSFIEVTETHRLQDLLHFILNQAKDSVTKERIK
ncbi:MAG: exonuclease domain-containing protein [Ignavibacteria bacterium]